jgi:flagellar motility protein MotE (MotC chaperone)
LWFLHYISQNGLKIIIILKVIVIAYILTGANDFFQFGDKPLMAEENAADAAKSAKTEDKAQAGKGAKKAAGKNVAAAPREDDEEEHRRSFLDDLLYLPGLNTENIKKEEIGRYLGLVEKKKSQVEDRIRMLGEREQQLKELEKSIDDKLKKLEEEAAYFQQTIQKEKKLNAERLENLIAFYQKMEPKKAAPVFEKMDRDLVVALFNSLPRKQVINILQLMNSDKSVELSEYYGRVRSGSEYEQLKLINTSLRKEFDACKGMPTENSD